MTFSAVLLNFWLETAYFGIFQHTYFCQKFGDEITLDRDLYCRQFAAPGIVIGKYFYLAEFGIDRDRGNG